MKVNEFTQVEKLEGVFVASQASDQLHSTSKNIDLKVPYTWSFSEKMGRVAAQNIVASFNGEKMTELDFCESPLLNIFDLGNETGLMVLADKMIPSRKKVKIHSGPKVYKTKMNLETPFINTRKEGIFKDLQ